MSERIYPVPDKTKGSGQRLVKPGWKLDPLLVEAIKDFCKEQSALQGVKIAPGTVIRGDMLRFGRNQRVIELYSKRKQERGDAIRYIDPIKRLKSRSSFRPGRAGKLPDS